MYVNIYIFFKLKNAYFDEFEMYVSVVKPCRTERKITFCPNQSNSVDLDLFDLSLQVSKRVINCCNRTGMPVFGFFFFTNILCTRYLG